MIKKLSIALCIFTGFIMGCKQQNDAPFVVTGNILNAPAKKILLMEIPYSSPEPIVLDSATLDKSGGFTLKANATEEGIYRLVIENGPDVILINDTKNIRVIMDINDYSNYVVEKSPASKSLHELFVSYRKDDSTVLSTFKQLDTLEKQTGTDSLVAVVKKRSVVELSNLNEHIKAFINETPSAAATFYAIGLASRTLPAEELKPIADNAAKKFKEHSGISRVKSLLAQQMGSEAPAYKLLNTQAPDLTMQDVNGKALSISSFRGKYVLIDFWASWCAPCRAENPNVVAAYNKFSSKNFTVLGVSLDKDREAWKKAIEKDKLAWPHMSDLKMWDSPAVNAYQFEGIPFNVLLDPQGKIIASSLSGEELESKLTEVLK